MHIRFLAAGIQLSRKRRAQQPPEAIRPLVAHLFETELHAFLRAAGCGAKRAENNIPNREDCAEVAVRFRLPRGVVHAVQVRRDDDGTPRCARSSEAGRRMLACENKEQDEKQSHLQIVGVLVHPVR